MSINQSISIQCSECSNSVSLISSAPRAICIISHYADEPIEGNARCICITFSRDVLRLFCKQLRFRIQAPWRARGKQSINKDNWKCTNCCFVFGKMQMKTNAIAVDGRLHKLHEMIHGIKVKCQINRFEWIAAANRTQGEADSMNGRQRIAKKKHFKRRLRTNRGDYIAEWVLRQLRDEM